MLYTQTHRTHTYVDMPYAYMYTSHTYIHTSHTYPHTSAERWQHWEDGWETITGQAQSSSVSVSDSRWQTLGGAAREVGRRSLNTHMHTHTRAARHCPSWQSSPACFKEQWRADTQSFEARQTCHCCDPCVPCAGWTFSGEGAVTKYFQNIVGACAFPASTDSLHYLGAAAAKSL